MNIAQRIIVKAIASYQARGGGVATFRVDCNFEPSCSEYAKQAVMRFGTFRGSVMALRRLRKCSARDQVGKHHDPVSRE